LDWPKAGLHPYDAKISLAQCPRLYFFRFKVMNLSAPCYGINQAFWIFSRHAEWPGFNTVTEANPNNVDRDIALMRKISEGDRVAFAEFYDLYSSLLFSIAVKILNDPKEAEDVLQDVFVQIWEKARSFDPRQGKPTSWAVTLVRNKSIDRIRASQRRSRLLENATADALPTQANLSTANESVWGREKAQMIQTAVGGLPAEQRQAIELAFFSGLTQNEISDQLHEPLGTIKARIRRGLFKLREKLGGSL
jgi:RNA polymerase sigma-70 factor (ECF subfamily)